jgi:adenosylcobinamide-GDP ribazoletransferase
MLHGFSARKDGLGCIFVDNVRRGHVITSSITLLVLSALSFGLLVKDWGVGAYVSLFVLLFTCLYLFSLAAVHFFRGRFGGITGDTLGALSEASELIFLMVVYIWLRHSIS